MFAAALAFIFLAAASAAPSVPIGAHVHHHHHHHAHVHIVKVPGSEAYQWHPSTDAEFQAWRKENRQRCGC